MLTAADLDKPVHSYSHGTKQKLGLVQAFQHDPEMVILDEPTEGLDPLVQETFFELLDEAAGAGRTVFCPATSCPRSRGPAGESPSSGPAAWSRWRQSQAFARRGSGGSG